MFAEQTNNRIILQSCLDCACIFMLSLLQHCALRGDLISLRCNLQGQQLIGRRAVCGAHARIPTPDERACATLSGQFSISRLAPLQFRLKNYGLSNASAGRLSIFQNIFISIIEQMAHHNNIVLLAALFRDSLILLTKHTQPIHANAAALRPDKYHVSASEAVRMAW